jgi:hypothetical protein
MCQTSPFCLVELKDCAKITEYYPVFYVCYFDLISESDRKFSNILNSDTIEFPCVIKSIFCWARNSNSYQFRFVSGRVSSFMHLSGPCVMLVMRAASITWASGRGLGPGNLEFFGPQMHSWAMPDLSVTSGTGLNHDAAMRQLTTGRNADAGLRFLRHLHVILQYHFYRQQYRRAGCTPFFKCRTVRHPVSPVPE